MDEIQGDLKNPEDRPALSSRFGAFDRQQERRNRQREEEFKRQYLQNKKAGALLKLETILSDTVPEVICRSILDIMCAVT